MTPHSQEGHPKARLVILISGSGSNLQAFIDRCNDNTLDADIVAVISNKAGVKGLERAQKAGIATAVLDHKTFESRESFDLALGDLIESYSPDLVILAGFMRILTSNFVNHFLGRLMNIHPSLLPKYPGLNTHQRAIDAGDKVAGATVHFVTPELDGGPAILQARVCIHDRDNADDLAARILAFEHQIYPMAAQWFCQGRLKMLDNHVFLDGEKLGETCLLLDEITE